MIGKILCRLGLHDCATFPGTLNGERIVRQVATCMRKDCKYGKLL